MVSKGAKGCRGQIAEIQMQGAGGHEPVTGWEPDCTSALSSAQHIAIEMTAAGEAGQ